MLNEQEHLNKFLKAQPKSIDDNKEYKEKNLNNLKIKYFKLLTELNELKIEEQNLQNMELESINISSYNDFDSKKCKTYNEY